MIEMNYYVNGQLFDTLELSKYNLAKTMFEMGYKFTGYKYVRTTSEGYTLEWEAA